MDSDLKLMFLELGSKMELFAMIPGLGESLQDYSKAGISLATELESLQDKVTKQDKEISSLYKRLASLELSFSQNESRISSLEKSSNDVVEQLPLESTLTLTTKETVQLTNGRNHIYGMAELKKTPLMWQLNTVNGIDIEMGDRIYIVTPGDFIFNNKGEIRMDWTSNPEFEINTVPLQSGEGYFVVQGNQDIYDGVNFSIVSDIEQ